MKLTISDHISLSICQSSRDKWNTKRRYREASVRRKVDLLVEAMAGDSSLLDTLVSICGRKSSPSCRVMRDDTALIEFDLGL